MSNVVSLDVARELKKAEDQAYHAKILVMDKAELLEEMVRFQQERAKVPELTLEMMVRGKILFKELEKNAETQELYILTRSYRRHLEYELQAYLQQRRAGS